MVVVVGEVVEEEGEKKGGERKPSMLGILNQPHRNGIAENFLKCLRFADGAGGRGRSQANADTHFHFPVFFFFFVAFLPLFSGSVVKHRVYLLLS